MSAEETKGAVEQPQQRASSWSLCGLHVERKTDVLALAAFLIALGSVIYQVSGYLKGAEIKTHSTEQVLIIKADIPGLGDATRFAARMSYTNEGQPGHNAIIKSEAIRFTLGKETYEQKWQEFVSIGDDGAKPIFKDREYAHPVPVMAGNAETHETYFAPRAVRCPEGDPGCNKYRNYLRWEDFIGLLEKNKTTKLEFDLVSEFYGEPARTATCSVQVNESFIKQLKNNGWHAPSCW